MIRLPKGAGAGPRDQVARLLDVFPTLTALAGIETPEGAEGNNLFAPPGHVPEIIAETRHKRTYRVAVREGSWKYIRTYRARRSLPSRGRAEAPAIAPGMRVKAKGVFLAGGVIHATKLTLKTPGDDDIELSGAIESISPAESEFRLHGLRILAEDLVDEAGLPLIGELSSGTWVKVEGKSRSDGSLEADELEELPAGDRDDEIEIIAERILQEGDDSLEIQAAGFRIFVSEDTRLKGFGGGEVRVVTEAETEGPDPFSPTRLLSADAPPFEEQLFDLARDPAERFDRIGEENLRADQLRAALDGWLARMEPTAARGVDRRALDPATVENLRELGYIE
jgi:hypothetical protein